MTDNNNHPTPPLWRVMMDAFLAETRAGKKCSVGFGAELRAVAYAIADRFADAANTSTDPIADVANWLVNEAQRAEAGKQ